MKILNNVELIYSVRSNRTELYTKKHKNNQKIRSTVQTDDHLLICSFRKLNLTYKYLMEVRNSIRFLILIKLECAIQNLLK